MSKQEYPLPDFLIKKGDFKRNPIDEKIDRLMEEYEQRFHDDFDTESNTIFEDELIEALEYCLTNNVTMDQVRPDWQGDLRE